MIFNTNLPGSSIQVIDEYNTISYDTSLFGTTESVLVIGTAFDGPAGKEIAIYNPEHAKYVFGGTYDSNARRSASLVAHIQDLYDKGSRTIYAMRVGGKEIGKVYRLKEDVPIYFKVAGAFPSNKYKDMSVLINLEDGTFDIFKTANKATIEEKREGVVESSESIIRTRINLGAAYTYDINSSLPEFIEYLNSFTRNNVFKFSLVNEKEEDITYSEEAKALSVGALFDGAYTIGRVNKTETVPVKELSILSGAPAYEKYSGNFIFNLTKNNDVESEWPLVDPLGSYEFLEIYGGLDNVSKKDTVDYEEVNMSKFEYYKKLGSGYAQTAKINGVEGAYTIKPTKSTDPMHTVEIGEGIYTIASNLKTDYRILTGVYADDVITGIKLTQKDFLKESIEKIPAIYAKTDDVSHEIAAHALYKLDDDSDAKYSFTIDVAEGNLTGLDKVSFKGGLKEDYQIKKLEQIDALTSGDYAIVQEENAYWIVKGNMENLPEVVMPLNMLSDENPDYLITFEKQVDGTIAYTINLSNGFAAVTTIFELVELLNLSVIGQVFKLAYINKYANEIVVKTPSVQIGKECRKLSVNMNIALPYTTSDNFVRQLAQHAEYTSLKTYQTHGAIGVRPLNDTSIKAVTEKCNALVEKDYDLYVKNATGKPVLDVDNLPYHIGKSVTVVAAQHTIQTLDGYKYVASGHSSYIGRACTLDSSVSTTNQIIPVVPHYTFGESQKVALNKTGYVTFENKNGVYKITDGITKAPIYSQFSRFATFRTIKLVDKIIRDATEPFIGKKNDMVNRNSMYTAIKSGLDAILDTYLEKYSFEMQYSKFDARLGNVDIEYNFDIIDEIRNVNNTVRVKSQA